MALDKNKEAEVVKFKRDVIKKLYENPNIIELLDNKNVDPESPDTAEWECIFPFIKVPEEIQEEVKCFIGVELDSVYLNELNPLYKEMQLIVYVICAVDILKMDGYKGTRTDLLADEIEETLNWNNTIGFTLQTYDTREGVFENSKYYYRRIRFRAPRSNTIRNGRKLY